MEKWGIKDIAAVVIIHIFTYLFIRIAGTAFSELFVYPTPVIFALLFLIPMLAFSFLTYSLKSRKKRIWIAETILAVLTILLLLACLNRSLVADIIENITGYCNNEALVFGFLFALLYMTGTFAGAQIGYLIYAGIKRIKTRREK